LGRPAAERPAPRQGVAHPRQDECRGARHHRPRARVIPAFEKFFSCPHDPEPEMLPKCPRCWFAAAGSPDSPSHTSCSDTGSACAVLRSSPLPLCDTLLYFYFVCDLASEPLSNMRVLDRVSRLGLMRSRWYMTEKIPELEEEHILKASAVPLYEMSGGTAKILSELWLRNREPFLSILPGELRTTFIQPYARRVHDSGVEIETGTRV